MMSLAQDWMQRLRKVVLIEQQRTPLRREEARS
jgi:hypothetical protein